MGSVRDRLRTIPRGVDLDIFDPDRVGAQRDHQPCPPMAPARRHADRDASRPPDAMEGRARFHRGGRDARPARHLLCSRRRRTAPRVSAANSRRRSSESGLAGLFRIVEECRDMPAAYMLADVVVSASSDPEGFGRVIVEAQAMGRPVVATDHGGARETIVPGVTGWLVPPRDPAALAAAIGEALSLGAEERQHLRGARSRTSPPVSPARRCAPARSKSMKSCCLVISNKLRQWFWQAHCQRLRNRSAGPVIPAQAGDHLICGSQASPGGPRIIKYQRCAKTKSFMTRLDRRSRDHRRDLAGRQTPRICRPGHWRRNCRRNRAGSREGSDRRSGRRPAARSRDRYRPRRRCRDHHSRLPEGLEILRHDAAHVMAEAVKELYPDTQVTFGPGDRDRVLLRFRSRRAVHARGSRQDRGAHARDRDAATRRSHARCGTATRLSRFFDEHRRELQGRIYRRDPGRRGDQPLSARRFCRPLRRTAPALDGLSRPGIQADERRRRLLARRPENAQLQRVYGTAFASQKDLDQYLFQLEEAERRDHRRLGRELDLFHMARRRSAASSGTRRAGPCFAQSRLICACGSTRPAIRRYGGRCCSTAACGKPPAIGRISARTCSSPKAATSGCSRSSR